jgi:hypothetical protein
MTAGIQDPTQAIGINCLSDGSYHRGCATLAAGRAIRYSTDLPTGIAEDAGFNPATRGVEFMAYPTLFKGLGNVYWQVRAEGHVRLQVFDAAGREVRNLVDGSMKPGSYSATWNGLSNSGRPVSTGIYFYKLQTSAGAYQQKVVVAR